MTSETKIETATATPIFDHAASNAAMLAFEKAASDAKATRKDIASKLSAMELALIFPAMDYASKTYDFQPLANIMGRKTIKLSPIAKRAIKATFMEFEFAIIGEEKRLAFLFTGEGAKVHDTAKLQVLRDTYDSGDNMLCDQIKNAFPAPTLTASAKVAKLAKGIAARMKSDGITKAELLAAINAMES